MARKPVIGVMGGGDAASPEAVGWATQLGSHIAREGWVLLSGGRNAGVMDAVSKGAKEAGGSVLGILPGGDASDASDALDIALVSGMGSARNNILVLSSDVVIACGLESAGTLSEVAMALKAGKPVVVLSEDVEGREFLKRIGGDRVHLASTPEVAIGVVRALLARP